MCILPSQALCASFPSARGRLVFYLGGGSGGPPYQVCSYELCPIGPHFCRESESALDQGPGSPFSRLQEERPLGGGTLGSQRGDGVGSTVLWVTSWACSLPLYSDDVSTSRMDPHLCPHVLGSCGNPPCWPVLSLDPESVFCDELTPGMHASHGAGVFLSPLGAQAPRAGSPLLQPWAALPWNLPPPSAQCFG